MRKISCLLFLLMAATAWAAESDVPPSVTDAAYERITSGHLWEGAVSLVEALRAWPDDPAQVDAALEPAYLLTFTVEYLMDADMRARFMREVFEPEKHPTDDLLHSFLLVLTTPKLTEEEYLPLVHRFYELTNSSHALVRAYALRVLADAYFMRDAELQANAQAELTKQFSGLQLTRGVQRDALYRVRDSFVDRPAEASAALQREVPVSVRGADPVALELSQALDTLSRGNPAEAASGLCAKLRDSQDPHVRYALLRFVGPFARTGDPDAEVALLAAAEPANEGPDGHIARVLLVANACEGRNAEEIRRWTQALLEEKRTLAFDHNLFEDLTGFAFTASESLADMGDKEGARQCLRSLAERFPQSAIATECQERMARLDTASSPEQ